MPQGKHTLTTSCSQGQMRRGKSYKAKETKITIRRVAVRFETTNVGEIMPPLNIRASFMFTQAA